VLSFQLFWSVGYEENVLQEGHADRISDHLIAFSHCPFCKVVAALHCTVVATTYRVFCEPSQRGNLQMKQSDPDRVFEFLPQFRKLFP